MARQSDPITLAELSRGLAAVTGRLDTKDAAGTAETLFVLDQLENRYRRKFADQWEFVRFAQQQNLNLDLAGPPHRLAVKR